MLKSLPVAFAALFLVVGCVSVGPDASIAPTTAATSGPSLGVTTPAPATPAATPAPTLAPTVAPTPTLAPTLPPTAPPTATAQVTEAPSNPPSSLPTPSASGGAGDRDLIFFDDMTDPTSGWDTLDGDIASISYDTGFLAFRYNQDKAWAYTVRDLGQTATTVVQAGDFYPDSDGFFGLLCGMKSSGTFYGAIVSTNGGLAFVQIDNSVVTVLQRNDGLGLDVALGSSNPLALECATSIDGVVTMIAGMNKTGPVAVYRQSGGPIDGFDVTGIYGEAANNAYVLGADTAAAWAAAPNGEMSSGAQILFAHIPTALQNNCFETPIWNSSATFDVTCLQQVKGKGGEILQYQQYDDGTGMNAGYQNLVTTFGVDSTGSCKTGPNETTWSFDNDTVGGHIQCAPQKIGIRFDWTDDLTSILATLIDFEGSYPDTYAQWVDGGPIIPQG